MHTALLALENVGHAFVVPTVASVLDPVVHAANESNGRGRIGEGYPLQNTGTCSTSGWLAPKLSWPGNFLAGRG